LSSFRETWEYHREQILILGHLFPKLRAKYTTSEKSYSFLFAFPPDHTVAYTLQQRWNMPPPSQFLSTLLKRKGCAFAPLQDEEETEPGLGCPHHYPFRQRVGPTTNAILEKPSPAIITE